jgi:hypothetical protein
VTSDELQQPHASFRGDEALDPLAVIRDSQLRDGIRTLFVQAQDLIDAGKVQAVVLAARRLACLYQLLVESGREELRGAVILSDHSMDLALTADMRGILILDDSVVLGTTLVRLKAEVLQHCPKAAVVVRCVVVDQQQRVDFLLADLGLEPLQERNTNEVQDFSTDIVRCLSQRQVPFFSDFPVSVRFGIPRKEWLEHLHNPRWMVCDVTPPLMNGSGLLALAHVPDERSRADVLSRLVPELAELVDGFKVRSYIRTHEETLEIVLVPIALLAPATVETIEACMQAVTRDLPLGPDAWSTWDDRTRQRVLQYHASLCILADYWTLLHGDDPVTAGAIESFLAPVPFKLFFGALTEQLRPALSKAAVAFAALPADTHPKPVQLRQTFPRPSPLLNKPHIQELLFATREMLSGIGIPSRPDRGTLTKIGLVFAHAISSIFGYVDDTVEAGQRRHIHALPNREAYDEWLASSEGRVLDHGLTLGELTRALVPGSLASDAWARSLVAFGVDIGNDLGIIVPVTQVDHDRGIVFRCYRLGETAFIAGRPLPFLIKRAGRLQVDDLDLMCTLGIQGYPVQPTVTPIDDAASEAAPTMPQAREIELELLRATVLNAVPGKLIEGWNGVVTDLVDTESFEADLRPVHDAKPVLARMPLAWVMDTQRDHVRPGLRLIWSVWEREQGGSKIRSSTLRLVPVPPVDLERARVAGERMARMLQDEDE